MSGEKKDELARQDVAKYPEAKIIELTGTGSTTSLVLRVNIEGRDHDLRLRLSAIEGYGVTGPAAVAELRAIRKEIGSVADMLMNPMGSISRTVSDLSKSTHELAVAISQKKKQ